MRNYSLKRRLKSGLVTTINAFGVSSTYIGTPKRISDTAQWVARKGSSKAAYIREIYPGKKVTMSPPLCLEDRVHKRYTDEYQWLQQPAFVASIPGGRVWGRSGTVITPDDTLLGDISREFGKYGGVFNRDHSVFRRLTLSKVRRVRGTVAVLASAGSYNYHHWLYDTLPKAHLLKKAGLFDGIDYFVVDHKGLKFQLEGLAALGIDRSRIICPEGEWNFHLQADELLVASLPSRLATVSDWVLRFLRDVFLKAPAAEPAGKKPGLYLSREKAPTRKLQNEAEVMAIMAANGFSRFFPEDHSIAETAAAFAGASSVAGVHGSGFANLVFCSTGTKVLDIVAPKHLDPYYWMLANQTNSHYAYLFGEGDQLPEHVDLVSHKIDDDIFLDTAKLERILNQLNSCS
jgi:capsular polysaccharide biosynthesis protein